MSADIDLTEFGPWYGNATSDAGEFIESIRRLAKLEPELTVTGHETGVLEGDIKNKLNDYEAVILERHEMILGFLEKPRSLDQVVSRGFIYREYYSRDNSFHPQEWRMVRHHLAWAIKNGTVEAESGQFSLVK
jgi:hypothetical protein